MLVAVALRSFAGYLGLARVFGWGGTLRGSLVSVFQGFFAIIGEMFIFAGGGCARDFHSVGLRHFPVIS